MALDITEANAVSSKYFDKTLTPQVYEQSPLFAKLKKNNQVTWDGGTQIQFPIRHTKMNRAETVETTEQIVFTNTETRTSGVLDWKKYVSQAMITWQQQIENGGRAQIVNLLRDKTEELRDDMFNKFHTDLYATTQATPSFSSLDTIIDATTTYAGIAVADAAEWLAIEDTAETILHYYNSSTCLSRRINQATFGIDKPNLIITTRDLASKIKGDLEPQKRYENNEMANMGFSNVEFESIPVIGDYACPAGYMFGICTKYWEFRYHPDYNFVTTPWKDLFQAGFPHHMVKVTTWVGNIVCRMRKVNFKYTALDYTA